MRNEITEWMLAQVAPPQQARTIVGDLLEAQPRPLEFWAAVVRATASIAGRDPRRLVVSITEFVIQFGFWAVVAWIISVGVSPRHPFLAIYGVIVGLFLLWRVILRIVMRRTSGWWTRSRRQRKSEAQENDRPIAG